MDVKATERAFDSVAEDYDGPRGNNALIQRMRGELWRAVNTRVRAGARLLDLGCGTGLDLAHFAALGYEVHGIDQAPEMIRKTRARIRAEQIEGRAHAEVLGIQSLEAVNRRGAFDAAYSNMGAINCVPDLESRSLALARILAPGGLFIASVIGRFCPWEIGYYLKARRLKRIVVRFSRGPVEVPLVEHSVWARYFLPREFAAAFQQDFQVEAVRTLQLLRPPPYLVDLSEQHPQLFASLGKVEDRIKDWPVVRNFGDSFLIVLKKR